MRATVVGSGAWGTALAIRLCKNGHDVTMWTHDPSRIPEMEATRRCRRLPETVLPEGLKLSGNYDCVRGSELVVIASPSFPMRSVCRSVAPHLDADAVVVTVTKGIEEGTCCRMSQIAAQETGKKVVVLTGPSHAEEVSQDIPTGLLAACEAPELAAFVQDAFMSENLRIYTSTDPVGAELGAALKNVIALCAGVCDGLGHGDNTKALLMTRGLTELARLGVAMGANKDTFTGLSGVGDLIVTCTSMHSRNRRAGILIGQGKDAQTAMQEVGAVVEGYYAAKSAWQLAGKMGVEMPITEAAYKVLYQGADAAAVTRELLMRSKKAEDAGWL